MTGSDRPGSRTDWSRNRARVLPTFGRETQGFTTAHPGRPNKPRTVWSDLRRKSQASSALLVVTYRPEFDPPWIGRPHVTALTLNRLGDREIAAIIDCVTGNKLLPPSIRRDIIERTDGIPLFVEEMTKAVLEAESEGDARKTAAAVPSSGLSVPASLHASLMARLDRLGPAKEVAQIGAAMGREFSPLSVGKRKGSRPPITHST